MAGPIRLRGIFSVLRMLDYEPPTLYIRQSAVWDQGYANFRDAVKATFAEITFHALG